MSQAQRTFRALLRFADGTCQPHTIYIRGTSVYPRYPSFDCEPLEKTDELVEIRGWGEDVEGRARAWRSDGSSWRILIPTRLAPLLLIVCLVSCGGGGDPRPVDATLRLSWLEGYGEARDRDGSIDLEFQHAALADLSIVNYQLEPIGSMMLYLENDGDRSAGQPLGGVDPRSKVALQFWIEGLQRDALIRQGVTVLVYWIEYTDSDRERQSTSRKRIRV